MSDLLLLFTSTAGVALGISIAFRVSSRPAPRPAHMPSLAPTAPAFALVAQLIPAARRLLPKRFRAALGEAHVTAGEPWPRRPDVPAGVALACALVAGGLCLFLGLAFEAWALYWLAAPVAAGTALMPLLDLRACSRARRVSVDAALPWMIDLLILPMLAGETFEDALDAYADNCNDPVLPGEIRRVVGVLRDGGRPSVTWSRFAARCASPAVEALVEVIAAAGPEVAPSVDALRALADRLRAEARARADELAAAASGRAFVPQVMMGFALAVAIIAPFIDRLD